MAGITGASFFLCLITAGDSAGLAGGTDLLDSRDDVLTAGELAGLGGLGLLPKRQQDS